MKMVGDLVRVIDLLIPGACPEMPTGPVSLSKGEQRAYIAKYGALPPHWSDEQCLKWECAREDAVMIRWRRGSTSNQREAARQWLARYHMDDTGRPKVWDARPAAPAAQKLPTLTLAG
ncbi:hypothetical protein ACFV42_48085 [Streptomyces solisilvae]|uniref:hypothetical protein n=1 Tax=Streptomyces malaysiensis TaxID=92644 RepID=UPI0036B76B15